MKIIQLFLSILFLSSTTLFAQDKKMSLEIKSSFDLQKYDKCISICNDGIDKYKTDQLSEFYLFKSLSYYYLASANKKNTNYNSNIKRAVTSLKKAIKKDKIGSYYRIYEDKFLLCKDLLLKEAIKIEQDKQPGLANYVEKNILHTFKNKTDKSETIFIVEKPIEKDKSEEVKTSENKSSDGKIDLIKYAKSKIGVPYKYGGTTDKGFDCSGFTWNVYYTKGVNLPRTASSQATLGKKIDPKKAEKGDLVFFADKSKISHVGIVTEYKNGKLYMIHASTSKGIRIDCIDDVEYWRSRFKYIKRI